MKNRRNPNDEVCGTQGRGVEESLEEGEISGFALPGEIWLAPSACRSLGKDTMKKRPNGGKGEDTGSVRACRRLLVRKHWIFVTGTLAASFFRLGHILILYTALAPHRT